MIASAKALGQDLLGTFEEQAGTVELLEQGRKEATELIQVCSPSGGKPLPESGQWHERSNLNKTTLNTMPQAKAGPGAGQ